MMNPVKLDTLLNEIEDFYRQMHHNASTLHLTGHWAEPPAHLAEPDTSLAFLDMEAKVFTDSLSQYVREIYGEELTFSLYGRGGATMLPDQWVWDNISGRGIDIDKAVGGSHEHDTELDRYNRARKVLKILKDVNKKVEAAVQQLPERWKEFLKANVGEAKANPRMSLRDFIRQNKEEIDAAILRVCSNCRLNDRERRMWIENDEGLYSWARSEGVRI